MLRGFFEESMYYIHSNFKNMTEMATFKLLLFFVEFSVIFFIIIIIAADIMMRRIAKEFMSYERIADRLAALDFRKAAAIIADAKLFSRLHRQYMYLIDKYSTDVSLLKEKLTRIKALIALLGDGDMPEEKKNMATTELFELHNAVKAKMAEYKLDNCR
jgi:methyl-accepting chemotaxis protein